MGADPRAISCLVGMLSTVCEVAPTVLVGPVTTSNGGGSGMTLYVGDLPAGLLWSDGKLSRFTWDGLSVEHPDVRYVQASIKNYFTKDYYFYA